MADWFELNPYLVEQINLERKLEEEKLQKKTIKQANQGFSLILRSTPFYFMVFAMTANPGIWVGCRYIVANHFYFLYNLDLV